MKEKFERHSVAEAENAQMAFLEFAHIESETALQTIQRFQLIVIKCREQGIVLDEGTKKRMLLARPSALFYFLKRNYLLAPAVGGPDLATLRLRRRQI